jgi:hypothetical protein
MEYREFHTEGAVLSSLVPADALKQMGERDFFNKERWESYLSEIKGADDGPVAVAPDEITVLTSVYAPTGEEAARMGHDTLHLVADYDRTLLMLLAYGPRLPYTSELDLQDAAEIGYPGKASLRLWFD